MEKHISVTYPESLALSLKMEKWEFEREMKTISLIKLYELGKISSGIAADMLELSRIEFLEIISKYQVSYINPGSIDELESDYNWVEGMPKC